MEPTNEPIKIGRITRKVEMTLGLSLACSVLVYVQEEFLNCLSREHPDSYLSILDNVAAILKKPDFVAYQEQEERFVFLRFYAKNGKWRAVYVEVVHQGQPKEWVVSALWSGKNIDLQEGRGNLDFVRVE